VILSYNYLNGLPKKNFLPTQVCTQKKDEQKKILQEERQQDDATKRYRGQTIMDLVILPKLCYGSFTFLCRNCGLSRQQWHSRRRYNVYILQHTVWWARHMESKLPVFHMYWCLSQAHLPRELRRQQSTIMVHGIQRQCICQST